MFKIADYKIESINDNLPDLIPDNIKHIGAENLSMELLYAMKDIKEKI